ncbi:MAG: carbon-nitrogen hydrolase family protein [Gammaproteobacteria bacterium]
MLHPKASIIQMTSCPDLEKNLQMAGALIKQAKQADATLVVLPEMFPIMGSDPRETVSIGETYGDGVIQNFLKDQAAHHKLWIVGGTIPIKTNDAHRVRAACLIYDDTGKVVGRYDKMHLFDVCITKGIEEYQESSTIEPGENILVVDTPLGRLAPCVCYDLRFPLLFQEFIRQQVEIIAVPSAFTVKTGMAHWEILARARSIDTLSYGLFACQVGAHSATRMTHGHSMITNPWGEVMTSLKKEIGVITAEIDLQFLKEVRKNLPILAQ